MTTLIERINEYLEALALNEQTRLQETAEAYAKKDGKSVDYYLETFRKSVHTYEVTYHPRSKYLRLTMNMGNGQTSVHAFIDRETGSVYKPAGWNAPAKGKDGKPQERYNLLDDDSRALLFEKCEFSGGYLYAYSCR